MKVTYIEHMGDDLSVCNAARVSFDKESEWDNWSVDVLQPKDKKLIRYLASHGHWSPFAHAVVKFRFKAPVYVARHLAKHQVGLVWNEVSRRYVDSTPELYWPEKWRKRAENVKQGSSEEEFVHQDLLNYATANILDLVDIYTAMIEEGCCPEQARMILPHNLYTEWIWTGSLHAWARVFNQRTYSGAQKETTELVKQIDPVMKKLFPVSWEVLTKTKE